MKRFLLGSRLFLTAALVASIGAMQLAGCSSGGKAGAEQGEATGKTPGAGGKSDPAPGGNAPTDDPEKTKMRSIVLTCPAFAEGQPIPPKFTGDGDDVSPPLVWSALPEGAQELALICDDPDAPTKEPWVHWVIYRIPPEATGLAEGVPKDLQPVQPAGAVQGKNSWPDGQNVGYRGPAPPPGKPHRYYFRLYVLDSMLPAKPGLTKKELLKAMTDHVIATGELMGTYRR